MNPVQIWFAEVAKIAAAGAEGRRVLWRCHDKSEWHDMADMPLSALVFSPEFEYKVVSDD